MGWKVEEGVVVKCFIYYSSEKIIVYDIIVVVECFIKMDDGYYRFLLVRIIRVILWLMKIY